MLDKIASLKEQINKLPHDSQGHRKYPTAIKKSICEMMSEGIGMNELAQAMGIHVTTLHYWRQPKKKQKAGFREIKITPAPNPQVTLQPRSISEIQIQFASGAQIQGLRMTDLIELFKQGVVL